MLNEESSLPTNHWKEKKPYCCNNKYNVAMDPQILRLTSQTSQK